MLDSAGPQILSFSPSEIRNGTFDHIDVSFNEPIDAGTFSTEDVALHGPQGALAVLSVVPLSAANFRVNFAPLTKRGDYQAVIGPNIADSDGNLMNQDNDAANGEMTADQFTASFRLILADVIFSGSTTISESNTQYEGKNILIDAATVAIDGTHQFNSVHLVNGGVLTHSANTTDQTHKVDLSVQEQVIVDATSRIDVSGKGYLAGHTTGNTTTGGAIAGAAGSYGGRGGMGINIPGGNRAAPAVYGDYADPDEVGSGGSGNESAVTTGGGLVRITTTTLQLDGAILSDAAVTLDPYGVGVGGGSGGGIFVNVESLSGSGSIRAQGGNGTSWASSHGFGRGGGGGGGRIAVYARDLSGFDLNRLSAPGGLGTDPTLQSGGAGSLYVRDKDDVFGTLILDALAGGRGVTPLGLPGVDNFVISDAVVIRGNGTWVEPEHVGLALKFENSLTVTTSGRLTLPGDWHLGSTATLNLSTSARITVNGTLTTEIPIAVTTGATLVVGNALTTDVPVSVTSSGFLQVFGGFTPKASLTISGGGIVEVLGPLISPHVLTVAGGTLSAEQITLPGLSVLGGGVITTSQGKKLSIDVTGAVLVDATSRIDVSGKGYLAGHTTGNTTTGGAIAGAAGSYGGRGGMGINFPGGNRAAPAVYGDYADPDEVGSGGSGNDPAVTTGGGLVRITTTTLQLDGAILSDAAVTLDPYGVGVGGGSGGGIFVNVESLSGSGSIRAQGGNGTSWASSHGFGRGGGGGGGRIAVYARDLSGFDLNRLSAPGGLGTDPTLQSGGAGSVYVRDKDDAHGLLVLDAVAGGVGVTPLGLPGLDNFVIPDAVVIRGNGTWVEPEHVGLALTFENSLTVTTSGRLTLPGDWHLGSTATLNLSSSARITVSGTLTTEIPIAVTTGATLVVGNALTTDVPVSVTSGGFLQVFGGFTPKASLTISGGGIVEVLGPLISPHVLTVAGGTLSAEQITLPGLSVLGGGVITTSQGKKLSIDVTGAVLVDATSRIDVSGKGYLAGHTTGNTTTGGAIAGAAGSYGGRGGMGINFPGGNRAAPGVYGDYADPDEVGSGGSGNDPAVTTGGGLVRITATTLQLDGTILSDAAVTVDPYGVGVGGGSGGGVFVNVDTFSGPGSIRARGGNGTSWGNSFGFGRGGGGGGGRIAVYARDLSSFDLNRLSAPGGLGTDPTLQSGGTGSVHIISGRLRTHVRSHQPYGLDIEFVDHGNGYVDSAIDRITLKTNKPLDLSSFTMEQFHIDGQMGSITPTGIVEVGDRTYQIALPFSLTENGPYHFTLLPTVLDEEGFALDQNANGIPGEADDDYSFDLVVDTVPPRVVQHTPSADVAGTIDHVDVWFSEKIDTTTFTTGDVAITKPNAQSLGVSSIQEVGFNRFRIGFPPQTLVGTYHVKIGPDVRDLAWNQLDQDRDGAFGEAAHDLYDATFNLVAVDLGLDGITSPSELIAGEPSTIGWTGQNRTGVELLGDWIDGVYLSTDDRWDISDILLSTVPHNGGLLAGQTYTGSAFATVPGVLPRDYRILVRADVANQERETNEADNLLGSNPIPLRVHTLPSNGVAINGTLTPADRADYYSVHVNAGENLGLALDGLASTEVNELYASFETIPSRLNFDHRSVKDETFLVRQDQMLAFTAPPGGGTYYVLVYGDVIDDSTVYNVAATTGDFVVTAITPNRGTNRLPDSTVDHRPVGRIISTVVSVFGAGFTADTVLEFLSSDGAVRTPQKINFVSPSTLTANLDLTTWPSGNYDVRIRKGNTHAVRPEAFRVLPGGAPRLETRVVTPSAVGIRLRTPQTIWIEYRNTGDAPMPAPLLRLTVDQGAAITANRSLAIPMSDNNVVPSGVSGTVRLIATGTSPTAGVLQPGDSGRIPVYYLGRSLSQETLVKFTLSSLTADEVSWGRTTSASRTVCNDHNESSPCRRSGIDYIEVTTSTVSEDWSVNWGTAAPRPESIPADAWNAITANLDQLIGSQWGNYVEALADNVNYIHALGQTTRDVNSVWNYELAQVSANLNPIRYLAGAVDAAVPTSDLPLTFSRIYAQPLVSRYRLGPLGRGWAHNWDVQVIRETTGNVNLRGPGGTERYFTLDRGSYVGQPGDHANLTFDGSAYRLVENDKTAWQFRPDGMLDFVADPNGNRITLTYTDGTLSAITHSNGAQLSLEYNLSGRIARLIDTRDAGTADDRITDYAYDATGEYLLEVAAPGDRVTHYDYHRDTALATKHALRSVEFPDETTRLFDYDNIGRLKETSTGNGSERVRFAYNTAGDVTVTDATDQVTRLSYGLNARLEQVRDGAGLVVEMSYCACGQVTEIVGPGGEKYSYTYDALGNLTNIRDPLRQSTTFTYEPTFSQLASVRDAKGNGLDYRYDPRGNLTSIIYPDGTHEEFAHTSEGLVLLATNRRGQVTTFVYNSGGQMTSKDYLSTPGVDYAYAYTNGNLTSATDANGTMQMNYDPVTHELTRIEYPGGESFDFLYDSVGRRTRRADESGNFVNYEYDPTTGSLDRMTDSVGDLIVDYDYDAAGQLVLKTLGNGVYTVYSYGVAGNVEQLVNHRADSSILSRFDYAYDASGRRVSMTANEGTYLYGYDPLGQLTSVTHPDGRLVTYSYDAAGNRREVSDNGVVTAYATNSLNQYTTVGGVTYTYDLDGNMKTKTESGITTTYTYDVENRLVGVTTPTDTWEYRYDPFGNRIVSIHNGVETKYLIDPVGLGNVAAEYDSSGNVLARFDHGFGLLKRTDSSGNEGFYTFSAIGHTSELTDATGGIANTYRYDPFGLSQGKSETVANAFEYVGELGVMNDVNGLEFMRARYHVPLLGRFTSQDPLQLRAGNANFYTYALNNPIDIIDPAGLLPCSDLEFEYDAGKEQWSNLWQTAVDLFKEKFELSMPTPAEAVVSPLKKVLEDGPLYYDTINKINRRYRHFNEYGEQADLYAGSYGGYGRKGPGSDGCSDSAKTADDWSGNQNYSSAFYILSHDPNDKLASAGFGDAAYVQPDQLLAYTVQFENESDATGPAREIVVTDQLDDDLDLDTFELTEITFANQSIILPLGVDHYSASIPFRANNAEVSVQIQANLDRATRKFTLTLQTFDTATGWFPEDPLTGLLYPEDGTGRGEGSVSYMVRPKTGLQSGAVIENRARIVFDFNDPIDTPLVRNTLDAVSPTSNVLPLPTLIARTNFEVSWTGADETNGSGIASYDVYFSIDNSEYALLIGGTIDTSATLVGEPGRTYAFYSVAKDNVGHEEPPPAMPDAEIHINAAPTISDIPNRETEKNIATGEIVFVIGDIETLANALIVSAISSDQTLVPDANIVLGGSGANRTLNITPAPNQSGSATISISVSDGLAGVSDSFVLSVLNVNHPPFLNTIANKQVTEGTTLEVNPVATDLDLPFDTLTFSLDPGAPAGVTIDAVGGKLRWTPMEAEGPGTYEITVRVIDNGSPPRSDTKAFTVTVLESNQSPVLTVSPNQSINEGSNFSFTATATDADLPAQTLTFSLAAGAPEGATINQSTGEFSWTPTETQDGSVTLVFRVTDNHNAVSADQSVTVTVNEVNDAPVLANPGDKELDEKTALTFNLSATDSDIVAGIVDSITYSIVSGQQTGMLLDGTSGVFSWTPTEAQDGLYAIVFRAKDNHDLAGTDQTVIVTVNEVNEAPPWQNATRPLDTNADGFVVPLDALLIINEINIPTILGSGARLPAARESNSTLPYFDTNGDGFCTSIDILLIFNALNGQTGEGELDVTVDPLARLLVFEIDFVLGFISREVVTMRLPTRGLSRVGLPETDFPNVVTAARTEHNRPWRLPVKTHNTESNLDTILDEIVEDVMQARLNSD